MMMMNQFICFKSVLVSYSL